MSWLNITPTDGPAWTIRNESVYSDEEVEPILQFLADRTGGLVGAVTVRLGRARNIDDHYSGEAASRRLHGVPDWVGTPLYMRCTLSPRVWDGYRRRARVCWHSTALVKLAHEKYAAGGKVDDVYAHLDALLDAGETKFGRWPIYHLADWEEMLLHIAAHEAAHLIQYDRGRGAGNSEIFCETFALQILNEYRVARAATSTSSTPRGGVLVTGPATAGSTTNRKEPTVAASTPTASAEKTVEPMKDLFDSLLAEAVKVADSTTKVEKSAYVRVDLLLDEGKKHKTLAYVNLPSSKAVRVEVPKKGGGGYDVIRVEKPKDIDKAIKAIRANHDRIVAAQAAA